MLFRKRYVLRFVVFYNDRENVTDLKSSLAKGFMIIKISAGEIHVDTESELATVSIKLPGTVLSRESFVKYQTSRSAGYLAIRGA